MKDLFVFAFVVLLLAGCGDSAEEKAIENETGERADVHLSAKGMKMAGTLEAETYSITAGNAAEIPEDFPEDVPLYHPSEAMAAMEIGRGYSVSLKTEDDINKVVSVYNDQIRSQGWSERASMDMGGNIMLAYVKDKRITNVSVISLDNETRLTINVSFKDCATD